MDSRMETPQTPAGPQNQGGQVPPSTPPLTVQQQPSPQEDKLRQKLAEVLGDILAKAQEVGFELATLDYGELGRCPGVKPLVEKSRELVVALKKLMALRKEFTSVQR